MPSAVTVGCLSSLGLREEIQKDTLKDMQNRKQEQTAASINKKDQQFEAVGDINNTDSINWNAAGHGGLRRFGQSSNKQNYSTDCLVSP